jgi:hypothetical protein
MLEPTASKAWDCARAPILEIDKDREGSTSVALHTVGTPDLAGLFVDWHQRPTVRSPLFASAKIFYCSFRGPRVSEGNETGGFACDGGIQDEALACDADQYRAVFSASEAGLGLARIRAVGGYCTDLHEQ